MGARGTWKRVVAWGYLVAALVLLPLLLEFLLEELGVIRPPIEGALPAAVVLALLYAGFVMNGLILLGWPFAIAVVWFFRDDRRLALPAIVFLIAEGLLAVSVLVWPGSEAMFRVCVAFGGLFAITAVRAWVLWVGGRI